jgi:hypothetical protein
MLPALRFGLFGTGYWATQTHAAALSTTPEARLVGVWGRDPARTAAAAAKYGVSAYDDPDALLRDVDAVPIAVPPDVQVPLAVRAARAGRHLLLEKPVALSAVGADELLAAVADSDVASVVFFTNRFVPAVEQVLRDAGSHRRLARRSRYRAVLRLRRRQPVRGIGVASGVGRPVGSRPARPPDLAGARASGGRHSPGRAVPDLACAHPARGRRRLRHDA